MKATDILRHEHRIILMVLDGADAVVESNKFRLDTVEQMLDFFRVFADRCHHMKEERYLFPTLGRRGMSMTGGPIAVMLSDHDAGRAYLGEIAEALPRAKRGDADAAATIRNDLRLYAGLLRAHISKENAVLFQMSDAILTPEDQSELADAFEKVEAEEIGPETHERFHRFAHDLKITLSMKQ